MKRAYDFAESVLINFIEYAARYWSLLVALALLHLLISLWLLSRQNRPDDSPLAQTNAAVLDFFFRKGYEVERILFQGRMSAEYILTRLGARICLHIKWWSKPAGDIPVKEISRARAALACDYAILISKEGFTRAARRMAAQVEVWLWEFYNLESEMESSVAALSSGMNTAAAARSGKKP